MSHRHRHQSMGATWSPVGSSASRVQPVEIGSLSTSSPNESQFFGSSSGVFFVNTVFRAFADSSPGSPLLNNTGHDTASPIQTAVDNCIAGQSEDADRPFVPIHDADDGSTANVKTYGIAERGLGRPPALEIAKRLIMSYFELWHPIFPFLHGPTFQQEVDSFYTKITDPPSRTQSQVRDNTRRAVIFQCIFNIGAMNTMDNIPPIESASTLMSLLGMLSTKHDTPSLQALLAAQLYFIATMSLQAASTVGGMLWRNIFHAGFHRCPFRYTQLSHHDCEMRKRIFWCSYATDRYLSQALGHPLGIQDSDIDVCVPGTRELHRPVPRDMHPKSAQNPEKEVLLHLPDGHPHLDQQPLDQETTSQTGTPGRSKVGEAQSIDSTRRVPLSPIRDQPRHRGEDVLASYIGYSRISGQVLELFHKSIHNRSVDNNNILILSSEVHAWWNGLPLQLQDLSLDMQSNHGYGFGPFFTVLYQQLILLVNRPFLSLNPTSPAFRSSLQSCIGASRTLISTLRDHSRSRQCLTAPGVLSGTWMAGLVIAFACELNAYPFRKGSMEIEACLDLLQTMACRWDSARHCHQVLGMLLTNLIARSEKRVITSQTLSTEPHELSHGGARKTQRSETTIERQDSDKRPRLGNQDHATNGIRGGVNPHHEQLWQGQSHLESEGFNDTLGDSTGISIDRINELDWPDIFGQVSWEALFQTGGDTATTDLANLWR